MLNLYTAYKWHYNKLLIITFILIFFFLSSICYGYYFGFESPNELLRWNKSDGTEWERDQIAPYNGNYSLKFETKEQSEKASVSAIVSGPVEVRWHWRVNSGSGGRLSFHTNQSDSNKICGTETWSEDSAIINKNGTYLLEWFISKDKGATYRISSNPSPNNWIGWIDDVFITPLDNSCNIVESSKSENYGDSETKVNETKVNETKVNETKVNETKVNETKVNGTKVNETKVNGTKVNETKLNVSDKTHILYVTRNYNYSNHTYPKIMEAIDNSTCGDKIVVSTGEYHEVVKVTKPLIMNSSLNSP